MPNLNSNLVASTIISNIVTIILTSFQITITTSEEYNECYNTTAISPPIITTTAPTTPFTTKSFVLSFCDSLFSYQMLYTGIIEEDFQASNRIYQKLSNWIQFLYPSFISTNNSPPRSSRHF